MRVRKDELDALRKDIEDFIKHYEASSRKVKDLMKENASLSAGAKASPVEKIEWLISEAKKAKAEDEEKAGQPEEKRLPETPKPEGRAPVLDESLKEEIRATLTETSEELSRIAGLLHEEKVTEPEQAPILPRFCCYCGRRLLPNAVYCDRCGTHVKGI